MEMVNRRKIAKTWIFSKKIFITLIMLSFAIIWLLPALLGVLTTFKPYGEFMRFAKTKNLFPIEWTLSNYQYVFENSPASVLGMAKNSLIVSTSHMLLAVFIASTSAYAYERLNFFGKEILFWTLMGLNMIPGVIGFVSQYYMYHDMGITNTLLSLIIPGLGGTFPIFLIRNFMTGVPKEMDESARIDGASEFQIYAHIVVPSIVPVLMVVGMSAFNGSWNDMMWPSLSINDPSC